MNICIFGDSITWGARLPARIGWANLLRNYIEQTTEDYYSVYDLGIDKDTTTNLLDRFDTEAKHRKPDVVIFAIGTNDSSYRKSKEFSETNLDLFEKNLKELINKSRKFTEKIIFVGLAKGSDAETIPLSRSTTGKSYDKDNIRLYGSTIKRLTQMEGLYFVDINSHLKDDDFDDGLHPNESGHQKIFKEVKVVVNEVLGIQHHLPLVVVDEKGKVLRYKYRTELKANEIVCVAAVWLTNTKGEILLSKRAITKRRDPGKWGPAVASILQKGETAKESILNGLKSELGLTGVGLKEVGRLYVGGENRFFCTWFCLENDSIKDKYTVKLNPTEISETMWITKDKLTRLVQAQPNIFVQSSDKYLKFIP